MRSAAYHLPKAVGRNGRRYACEFGHRQIGAQAQLTGAERDQFLLRPGRASEQEPGEPGQAIDPRCCPNLVHWHATRQARDSPCSGDPGDEQAAACAWQFGCVIGQSSVASLIIVLPRDPSTLAAILPLAGQLSCQRERAQHRRFWPGEPDFRYAPSVLDPAARP